MSTLLGIKIEITLFPNKLIHMKTLKERHHNIGNIVDGFTIAVLVIVTLLVI